MARLLGLQVRRKQAKVNQWEKQESNMRKRRKSNVSLSPRRHLFASGAVWGVRMRIFFLGSYSAYDSFSLLKAQLVAI